jgi:hypothetical protein
VTNVSNLYPERRLMRTRTYAATALLTAVLALAGGTAAHAAGSVPNPGADSLEDQLIRDIGVNLCKNSLGLPSLTIGYACARA